MKPKLKLLWLIAFLLPVFSFSPKPVKKPAHNFCATAVTSISSELFQPFCVVTGYKLTPSGATNVDHYDWYWNYNSNGDYTNSNYEGTTYPSIHDWIIYQGPYDGSCDPVYVLVYAIDNSSCRSGKYQILTDNCVPYDNCSPLKRGTKQ